MENGPEVIAKKFLNRTNRHLFLTGRAGTGKTTFLRGIISETHKKAVIAAPTGVAAINAGGVTLHSLFQLPFGGYVPSESYQFTEVPGSEINNPRTLMRHLHMHETKRRLIREMELLIIDEVSMLRADILDAIDRILQSVRRQRGIAFGGVQLLFIGDLLQLPPVVREDEWAILRNFYKSIHFFEAVALKDEPPLYIELEKIYRQSDPVFIRLLNNFRDNRVTQEDVAILNRYYKPDFSPGEQEGYIYLTTHNRIADEVNRRELKKLPGKIYSYAAGVEKDFRDHQFPLDQELQLKKGAQVMFIKNDLSGYQRFFNGKIGTVTELGEDEIEVGFNDGSDPVQVEKHVWLNKRYKLNITDNSIEEEVLGSFTQFPLKLAWAVTVHKSQGLTFERAIIDVENAFAPGQIYVALSRLVSLDGLVLSSPVPANGFAPDRDIAAFAATRPPDSEIDNILERETHRFVKSRLLQYFDFGDLQEAFNYHLRSYTKDEKRSAKQRYMPRVLDIQARFRPEAVVAGRFRGEIVEITDRGGEEYLGQLKERVAAALGYFEPRLRGISAAIVSLIDELHDAVGVKQYLKELRELEAAFFAKLQLLRKSVALVEAVQQRRDLVKREYSSDAEMKAREELAGKAAGKRGKKIGGTGKKGAGKKGTGKKVQKGDSARLSYEMLRGGKGIGEIAKERELAESTIQGHMSEFIRKGELDILELMDEDRYAEIRKAIRDHYKDSLTPVLKALGKGYSFGDIKMVMATARE
ncbi:MAG: helix-turn-helix domain-containing protein [Bacteroidales bacterium]